MDDDYSKVVEPLLRSFRPEILKYFGNVDHDLKVDKSVVTELDKSIEKRVREELAKSFPDIGFDGEEFGKSGNTDKYWLIDPIDGTQNFIRGLKAIGTILGLVDNGVVIFSALYEPIDDCLYIALKDKGVTLNGEKVKVSDRPISTAFIETASDTMDDSHFRIMQLLHKNKVHVMRTHGAADRAMNITAGKIEGTIRTFAGGHAWDYAPGNMMMREAGAVVTYYDGKDELESRSFSVLTPQVEKEIGSALKEIING